MKTLGIVGCGNLGSTIARGIMAKLSCYYKVIGVLDAVPAKAKKIAEFFGCRTCDSLNELLSYNLDCVIEAAAPDVLKQIAIEVLCSGSDLMPLSIGAFADDEFSAKLKETAETTGKRVYLVSGAIGGLDLMRAATFAGEIYTQIVTRKSPSSLIGAPGVTGLTLSESDVETVFEGTARGAIKAFPKNVNVAVALGVCTVGVDNTKVKIISDPSVTQNIHSIELSGEFGGAKVVISAKPSPDNLRSSKLAAMSVLARLESLVSPISFF